jgi:hypothetical protein
MKPGRFAIPLHYVECAGNYLLLVDHAGFAPGVPHLANLPFASLHTFFTGAFSGHLMNLPLLSRHGAALEGEAAVIDNAAKMANEIAFM